MIPWFIVDLIGVLASPFGWEVYVTARSDNRLGAERIHFIRRVAGAQKLRRLKPHQAGTPSRSAPD
jgi:hypothetical protein